MLYENICRSGCGVSVVGFQRVQAEAEKDEFINEPVPAQQVKYISGKEANLWIYDWKKWIQMITAWGKLYARELFENRRFPDVAIHEDEAFIYQLLYYSGTTAYTNGAFYFYRSNAAGIMSGRFQKKSMVIFKIMDERAEFYLQNGETELEALTRDREFFTAVQYFHQAGKNSSVWKGARQEIRKKQKELYWILMKKKSFFVARRLKYTGALLCPEIFYGYYYEKPGKWRGVICCIKEKASRKKKKESR